MKNIVLPIDCSLRINFNNLLEILHQNNVCTNNNFFLPAELNKFEYSAPNICICITSLAELFGANNGLACYDEITNGIHGLKIVYQGCDYVLQPCNNEHVFYIALASAIRRDIPSFVIFTEITNNNCIQLFKLDFGNRVCLSNLLFRNKKWPEFLMRTNFAFKIERTSL